MPSKTCFLGYTFFKVINVLKYTKKQMMKDKEKHINEFIKASSLTFRLDPSATLL